MRKLFLEWRRIASNYLGDYYPLASYSPAPDVWMAWQFHRPATTGSAAPQATSV